MRHWRERVAWFGGLGLLLLSFGCGGGGQEEGSIRQARAHKDFNVPDFLLRYAQDSTRLFAKSEADIDSLRKLLRKLGGKKRREAYRQLAALYVLQAEGRTERTDAKRDWRNAKRAASKSLSGARDPMSRSEAMFVHLWCAWRAGDREAKKRAIDFTDKHRQAGELFNIAWILRGEIDLRAKRYDAARKNYRFMFGQLGHPLYGLALLRTADAYEAQDNIKEADAALDEVLMLGCDANANEAVLEIARVAAGQLEIALREDEHGTLRPVSCKELKKQGNPDKPWLK